MNKKLGLLGILLMAVVVTTYSVGGTYAKYVSSIDGGTDTARVATWSFGVDGEELTLFTTEYTNGEGENIIVTDPSGDGANVVAPGAKGNGTVVIKGNAETNYYYVVDATVNNPFRKTHVENKGTPETDDDEVVVDYDPIKFSLDGVNYGYTSDTLPAALKGTEATVVAANTETSSTVTIYWKWEFSTSEANDVLDTELSGVSGNISVNATVKAIQSDKAAGTFVSLTA